MTDTVDHVERVRDALLALTVETDWGQVCFRTGNGIPMGMSRKQERLARHALASLDALESERNELREALRDIGKVANPELHAIGSTREEIVQALIFIEDRSFALSQDKEGA